VAVTHAGVHRRGLEGGERNAADDLGAPLPDMIEDYLGAYPNVRRVPLV
jgi:hypothetical protein